MLTVFAEMSGSAPNNHILGSSQLPENPAPESLIPSSGLLGYTHVSDTHSQKDINTHKLS